MTEQRYRLDPESKLEGWETWEVLRLLEAAGLTIPQSGYDQLTKGIQAELVPVDPTEPEPTA